MKGWIVAVVTACSLFTVVLAKPFYEAKEGEVIAQFFKPDSKYTVKPGYCTYMTYPPKNDYYILFACDNNPKQGIYGAANTVAYTLRL